MEISGEKICMNRIGRTIMNQFIIANDFNVPDNKDDVRHIVKGLGQLKIEGVKRVESYIKVTGNLLLKVLYITDAAIPGLASLEGEIPFEEMVYIDDGEDGDVQVQVVRTELQVQVIHSRKLEIKAVAELDIHQEFMEAEEVVSGLETEKQIYQKRQEIEFLELYENKRDIYRIKEECLLPGTKENIEKIIWEEIKLGKMDTKLSEGRLNINGELQLFCIYRSREGKNDWIEQIVPFQGKIECQGADEEFYHHVYRELGGTSVEVRLDEDGEMRKLGVEAALEIRLLVYKEKKIKLLEDMYSLNENCDLETKRIFFEEIVMQNHSKCKIAEQLSLPEVRDEMLQICHSNGEVQIEKKEVVDEGIQVEGIVHIDFMYVKANDQMPFGVWSGMIPFSFLIECEDGGSNLHYDITYSLEQMAVELAGTGEIEVKAVLAFQSFIRKAKSLQVVDTFVFEPYEEKGQEKKPGIVGYVVKKGDDLWHLAKKYSTTEESIMEMNSLTTNNLKEGDKILIFKENISIL